LLFAEAVTPGSNPGDAYHDQTLCRLIDGGM
jgi:hypothetical protein